MKNESVCGIGVGSYHVHTAFCDGRNTVEEYVRAAIDRGLHSIGLSGHGYTPFDLRYCMKDTDGYIAEVLRVREKYRGRIRVLLGVEEDAFAPVERGRFDYIIGSSHYVYADGRYWPVDSGPEYYRRCLAQFGGDAAAFAAQYYDALCGYIERRRPDIIGHFDLPTKFEEQFEPVLSADPAYREIAAAAMKRAAAVGCVFEVNTGAIARGLRTAPYPSQALLEQLYRAGGRVILSSDSHGTDTLVFGFDEACRLLRSIGFERVCDFGEEGLTERSL